MIGRVCAWGMTGRVVVVALREHDLAVVEVLGLERVGQLAALAVAHVGQDFDLLEHGLVLFFLLAPRVDHHVPERAAVHRPHGGLRVAALDGGRARRVVHEGQLAEPAAGHVVHDGLPVVDAVHVAVELAAVHDVEVVRVGVPLLDDDLAGGHFFLEHGVENLLLLDPVQVVEEEAVRDGGLDARHPVLYDQSIMASLG